jgi:hypothetical protein
MPSVGPRKSINADPSGWRARSMLDRCCRLRAPRLAAGLTHGLCDCGMDLSPFGSAIADMPVKGSCEPRRPFRRNSRGILRG